jgi:fluoride exporter
MPAEPPTTTIAATAAQARPPGAEARHRRLVLAAVAAGGALGGMARYELGAVWPTSPGGFPWVTFVINVVGSLVLGVVLTVVVEQWPPSRYVRPFLATGVCGGFTTWSTFMTDSTLLTKDGHAGLAATYVVATLAAGLVATVAGVWIGRRPRLTLAVAPSSP